MASDLVRRDVVVIGGSAGGLEALKRIVADLPPDLDATVLVVIHTSPSTPEFLARLLARAGPLPARTAGHTQPLRPAHIYVPSRDRHLLVGHGDRALVVRGPRENRARPAVDPLFRSAARWCGARVIGVVLSGALDDGAAGAAAIAASGGTVLVQSRSDALATGMPAAALAAVPDAATYPAAQLGGAIADLVAAPIPLSPTTPDDSRRLPTTPDDSRRLPTTPDADLIAENAMSERGGWAAGSAGPRPGTPAGLGCPECTGGLNMISTAGTAHYRCHVGHAFSPQTLAEAKAQDVEVALWTAISALQEKALLHHQMAATAADQNDVRIEKRHLTTADEAVETAALISRHILGSDEL